MAGSSDIHKDSLPRQLAELDRRLTLLERSPGISRSAVVDPADPDDVIVEAGRLTTQSDPTNPDSLDEDGSLGLGVYRWDGNERTASFRVSDTKGLEAPLVYTDWRKTSGGYEFVNVTSASYTDVWHVDLPMVQTDTFSVGWYATVPAGTTAKWTVDIYNTAYATSERTTTGAGLEWFEVRWQHGQPVDAWPAGWGTRIRIRCYRSAGAGTIEVREPTALALGDTADASADGWYN